MFVIARLACIYHGFYRYIFLNSFVFFISKTVKANVPTLLLGYVVRRLVNNQVVRKIKIAVENDVKNWAYISLR